MWYLSQAFLMTFEELDSYYTQNWQDMDNHDSNDTIFTLIPYSEERECLSPRFGSLQTPRFKVEDQAAASVAVP